MAVDTSLMTGPERMFYDDLNALGVNLEAFIVRSPREWFYDIYGYRLEKPDGTVLVGSMPWDLGTYSRIVALAKGE